MKLVADPMPEKIACWLRIFEYDAALDSSLSLKQLTEKSIATNAVFLTRRIFIPEGILYEKIEYIQREQCDDQPRYINEHFN